MKRSTIAEIFSALLVLLFVYTALNKLIDYSTFKSQLSKSPFITDFAATIAWALPAIELIVALTLLFSKTRLVGLYSSLFLMTMFTAYIYAMLNFSYYIPCACGGVLSKMSWGQHLWFNILFVLIAVCGILFESNKARITQVSKRDQEVTYSQFARV